MHNRAAKYKKRLVGPINKWKSCLSFYCGPKNETSCRKMLTIFTWNARSPTTSKRRERSGSVACGRTFFQSPFRADLFATHRPEKHFLRLQTPTWTHLTVTDTHLTFIGIFIHFTVAGDHPPHPFRVPWKFWRKKSTLFFLHGRQWKLVMKWKLVVQVPAVEMESVGQWGPCRRGVKVYKFEMPS